MNQHKIQVFISHSWNYSNHYKKLSDWIFNHDWKIGDVPINFIDKSIPKDDPIHNAPTAEALRNAIFKEIKNSHLVVIPTGMYATYSKWIKEEIGGANYHKRPIIAVNPWGQEKKSSIVLNNATEGKSVGWNKETVVKAIWRQYDKTY